MSGQSRRGSAIEAVTNVLVGLGISWVANMLIFPLFGFQVAPGAAFQIGLIFTVISLARSYLLRRVFNWITVARAP